MRHSLSTRFLSRKREIAAEWLRPWWHGWRTSFLQSKWTVAWLGKIVSRSRRQPRLICWAHAKMLQLNALFSLPVYVNVNSVGICSHRQYGRPICSNRHKLCRSWRFLIFCWRLFEMGLDVDWRHSNNYQQEFYHDHPTQSSLLPYRTQRNARSSAIPIVRFRRWKFHANDSVCRGEYLLTHVKSPLDSLAILSLSNGMRRKEEWKSVREQWSTEIIILFTRTNKF